MVPPVNTTTRVLTTTSVPFHYYFSYSSNASSWGAPCHYDYASNALLFLPFLQRPPLLLLLFRAGPSRAERFGTESSRPRLEKEIEGVVAAAGVRGCAGNTVTAGSRE